MAGDSRSAVDFSAHYFKVKGLNPQVCLEKENGRKKLDIS
jgi:hypothetical protein